MKEPIRDRLGILLDVFSPWEDISLTYRQFAAELGAPVTEAAVKRWPQRQKFPAEAARLIVAQARERGLSGVTLEWVLWGEGPRPQRVARATPERPRPPDRAPSERAEKASRGPAAPHEPHGRYAARIAEALQLDLSHNEFGQWSSDEVQHTVIWALKDLARRLFVLHFDMGKTFELTDEWAGKVGLPVRPPDQSADAPGPADA
ncbi:MAG TPA: hypothetical protein VH137_04210 [Gemmatimonadales bacterium]|jgi:hypothetical protein|nr:hypothetical protein [Gemmatimonadales bacterium]